MSEIFDACSRSRWAEAERLLDADPRGALYFRDRQGWSVLHEACNRNAPVELVRKALTFGLNPNEQNVTLRTPLHYAMQKTVSLDLVYLMLSVGANPNIGDKLGKTPVHWAVLENVSVHMMSLLVSAGGDLNRPDHEGKTPIHTAIEYNVSHSLLQYLLDQGGDPNWLDNEGASALYTAVVVNSKPSIIQILLKSDANIETMRLRVAKRHGNAMLCAQIEKGLIFTSLCAALSIRRIGRCSYIRVMPLELLHILAKMLYPEFGDHLIQQETAAAEDMQD